MTRLPRISGLLRIDVTLGVPSLSYSGCVRGGRVRPPSLAFEDQELHRTILTASVFPCTTHEAKGHASNKQTLPGCLYLAGVVALCQGGPRRPGSVWLRGWAGLTKASVNNTRGRTSGGKRSCEMLRDTWSLLTGARA